MNDLDLCLEVVYGQLNHASHSPLNISETVRDRCLVPKDHQIGNGLWRVERSCYRWRRVTPKGQVVTSVRLEPNISKTAGDAI